MVAAVTALAAFSLLAFELTATDRGMTSALQGQMSRARLLAASDAGLMLAIDGLANGDRTRRWAIDGRTVERKFDDVALSITVEDEWGKLSTGTLSQSQVERMLAAIGLSGPQLASLTDAIVDWVDNDRLPLPNGAEADDPYYVMRNIRPRNSAVRTLDELAEVKGMTPAILARLRPALTPFGGPDRPFHRHNAAVLALATIVDGGIGDPEVIARQKALEGQRPTLGAGDADALVGVPLSVRVTARATDGARISRVTVIQLTGLARPAFEIRTTDWATDIATGR